MARGVNKVILIGHLGKDPEVHFSASGVAFGNLNLATTGSQKDKDSGQWVDHTEWHRVVVLGRTAEIAKEFLQKGSHVYIEGRLQTKKYIDKNQVERYQTEVVASDMQMLGGNGGDGGGDGYAAPGSEQRSSSKPAARASAPSPAPATNHDDYSDVPF